MYECIYRYLFDMVIFVHVYKRDEIIRVIKSRRMKSAVHRTQTIYTGCFTTCGHYCRRWFPRSLWRKKFI